MSKVGPVPVSRIILTRIMSFEHIHGRDTMATILLSAVESSMFQEDKAHSLERYTGTREQGMSQGRMERWRKPEAAVPVRQHQSSMAAL